MLVLTTMPGRTTPQIRVPSACKVNLVSLIQKVGLADTHRFPLIDSRVVHRVSERVGTIFSVLPIMEHALEADVHDFGRVRDGVGKSSEYDLEVSTFGRNYEEHRLSPIEESRIERFMHIPTETQKSRRDEN